MTRGPVAPATMDPPPPNLPGTPYSTWWTTWNATLQDYRQFGVPHVRSCQILFADGSVRTFSDSTKDDLLNNGFPANAASRFSDNTPELPPTDVFSRWRLSQE
jgi:prepilin-type processing-associated H-X9-DG protein